LKPNSGQMPRFIAVRQLFQRFAFLALVGGAFALMLLGKADNILLERVRVTVVDISTPILDAMSRPAATFAEMAENIRELAKIRTENARLREENLRLLRWQTVALELEAENSALRGLMNYSPGPESGYISARVIADTGGSFVHSLLLNAGARDGARKGQAIITGEGLVGRVSDVGLRSARGLLLTDLNSRIPVVVESTRARAILSGDNSDRPRLTHLTGATRVAPGDRLVTSGHGGSFPPGLPVGVIISVGEGGVRVEPFVNRHRLEFVRVVDYGLAGMLLPTTEKPTSGGRR
jgi:rod shape-determining protein MreC